MKTVYSFTLGWLYPRMMSTYGDRGNILALLYRCRKRNIKLTVKPLDEKSSSTDFTSVDAFFGGGAQDREQALVMADLKGKKQEAIIDRIEKDIPSLFVCGSPQLMGKWYEPGVGKRIQGVGIFDIETSHPGEDKPRLIGNLVARLHWEAIQKNTSHSTRQSYLIGFENHGGRTRLGKNVTPLAEVLYGNGNNGNDKTEGVVYKNAVGTYLHGPLLPKNPHIADWFISRILEVKYKEKIILSELDDTLEYTAQNTVAKRLGIDL